TTDFLKGTLNINGDASQLTQVFMNLIMNAEEAVKGQGGGNITVSSGVEEGWVKVSVSDDGPGIPRENLDQIFLPFFTTKDIGEGTGLGLSMCYGIITNHGGVINAENNKDGGVTFTVQLPLLGKGRQVVLPLEME
ncbi:MAG: HAMP domain-containing sensor histidine kinase, partial [Dehalococcoidales bacterium]